MRGTRFGTGAFHFHRWAPFVAVPVAVVLAIALGFSFVAEARRTAGAFGLPLDDAWIHLGYARTIAETGRFAFCEGGPSTQGSTSPLFTLVLAFVWPWMPDEKFLAYGVGMAAQGMFLAFVIPWAMHRFRSLAWGLAVALVLAVDGRIVLLSVSGMETTLFLAFVAAAFLARAEGRWLVASVVAGLSAWARPEGVLLAAVFLLDGLLPARGREGGERRTARIPPAWTTWGGMVALSAAGIGTWAAFNAWIGGTAFPNTLAAKTAFYASNARAAFVAGDVLAPLLRWGWVALLPGVVWSLGREAWLLARGREGTVRAEAGWAVALPLAYLLVLPFGHRFARYMVPILPAVAVLGVAGFRDLGSRLVPSRPSALAWAAIALAFAGQWSVLPDARREYATFCAYHLDRHERAGRWLERNTPPDAVVATHDVGAIGFYSRRAIVDTVGVIEREPISHLGRPDYRDWLEGYLTARGVTHVAALRNWLEIANVDPLFVADPRPEILEVYPWVPGRSHVVAPEATRLESRAAQSLADGDAVGAASLLDRSLAVDDENSRAWTLRGGAMEMQRRLSEAERSYLRALALHPDSEDVRFRLGATLAAMGRREEARTLIEGLLVAHPDDARARALYRALGGS